MAFNAFVIILTFGLFAFDKIMAVVGIPIRIPNVILLLTFILGIEAWIGSVAAMVLCRHKVRKTKFIVAATCGGFMNFLLPFLA